MLLSTLVQPHRLLPQKALRQTAQNGSLQWASLRGRNRTHRPCSEVLKMVSTGVTRLDVLLQHLSPHAQQQQVMIHLRQLLPWQCLQNHHRLGQNILKKQEFQHNHTVIQKKHPSLEKPTQLYLIKTWNLQLQKSRTNYTLPKSWSNSGALILPATFEMLRNILNPRSKCNYLHSIRSPLNPMAFHHNPKPERLLHIKKISKPESMKNMQSLQTAVTNL